MTAILALRKKIGKNYEVVWGADSRFTVNNEICQITNTHKYVEYDHFTALFCGVASVQGVLEEFNRKKSLKNRKFMKMKNKINVLEFVEAVTKLLREKLGNLTSSDGGDRFSLIIVTKNKLYHMDEWGFCSEHDKFLSSGSGEPYLNASILMNIDSNMETIDKLLELAYNSIQTAISLNISCGGEITVKRLKVKDE